MSKERVEEILRTIKKDAQELERTADDALRNINDPVTVNERQKSIKRIKENIDNDVDFLEKNG